MCRVSCVCVCVCVCVVCVCVGVNGRGDGLEDSNFPVLTVSGSVAVATLAPARPSFAPAPRLAVGVAREGRVVAAKSRGALKKRAPERPPVLTYGDSQGEYE